MKTFLRTDSKNVDFINLITLLDEDLAIRDGNEHSFYAQFNKIDKINHVIVCSYNNIPVACGAFKEYNIDTVEIKRMFVKPTFRGQNIGKEILEKLETWASELDFSKCILETGKKQPEAIRLYQKSGYKLISNYDQYEHMENSVCMAKIASSQ